MESYDLFVIYYKYAKKIPVELFKHEEHVKLPTLIYIFHSIISDSSPIYFLFFYR